MSLYETISVRRSVRSYSKEPVSEELLGKIKDHVHNIEQLFGQEATFDVVPGKKAPYAVLAYCEDGLGEYINVGYCLQEIDLYIQSLGLGSLWYGAKYPTKNRKDGYCITLAFGNTDVPFRKSEDEFKRLSVSEISNVDNAVARAVRLAPSARNSQPWELTCEDGRIFIYHHGRGLFRMALKKKLSKIDLGIATKIAELALIRYGEKIKEVSITGDDNVFGTCITY